MTAVTIKPKLLKVCSTDIKRWSVLFNFKKRISHTSNDIEGYMPCSCAKNFHSSIDKAISSFGDPNYFLELLLISFKIVSLSKERYNRKKHKLDTRTL